jgi:hypothetical protein
MGEHYPTDLACCDPGVTEPIGPTAAGRDEEAEQAGDTAPGGEHRLGRRGLLRRAGVLGVASAAGAATGLLGSSESAGAHGTSHLESATASEPALHGRNTASGGLAILGDVPGNGRGVMGVVPGSGVGVFGLQGAGTESGAEYTGLLGIAVQGIGCCGVAGVKPAWSTTVGAGVWGRAVISGGTTPASLGVLATKENPAFPAEGTPVNTGVYGRAFVAGGAGVAARAPADADALRVHGRALFSSVGAGLIGAGANSGTVATEAVTASSLVSVTLTGDPRNHAAVEWVERNPGVGFTVHLNRNVGNGTPFSYFIVEPTV